MLSYTNFGSSKGEDPAKIQKAVKYLHKHHPNIVVDGEIQANFALDSDLLEENFPFTTLAGEPANTFIFPNLAAGNIAYKFVYKIREPRLEDPHRISKIEILLQNKNSAA